MQGTEGQSYNITAHGIADHGHTNRQSAGPFPLFSHRGDSVDSSRAQVILSFDKWPASSEMTMTSRNSLRPMSGNSPAVSLSVSQVVRNATQLHLCHLFFWTINLPSVFGASSTGTQDDSLFWGSTGRRPDSTGRQPPPPIKASRYTSRSAKTVARRLPRVPNTQLCYVFNVTRGQ